jgi:hypothetical protein
VISILEDRGDQRVVATEAALSDAQPCSGKQPQLLTQE